MNWEIQPIPMVEPGMTPLPLEAPALLGALEWVEAGKFSRKQREWLLRRDVDSKTGLIRCQFQGRTKSGNWTQCPLNEKTYGGKQNFHAHHIVPQGWWDFWYGQQRLNGEHESPNQPWNGIILCGKVHHNGPNGIHPDYSEALSNYRHNPGGFKEVARSHQELTEMGVPYWNTEYDDLLFRIATERTEEYLFFNPLDVWPKD